MKKDTNNEYCVKVRASSDNMAELRWTYNSKCSAFIIDVISDIIVDQDDEAYKSDAVEKCFSDIKESKFDGYAINEKRRAYYIDAHDFRKRGSRYSINNRKVPSRVQIFAVDADSNIIDCGADSVTILGKIALKYTAKNKFFNRSEYTVRFECSNGYTDGMAAYIVDIDNKTYYIPITKEMLGKELQITMPAKQELKVDAFPQYKKVLNISCME